MRGHHILAAALLLALAGSSMAVPVAILEPGVYTMRLADGDVLYRKRCPNRDFLSAYTCNSGTPVDVLPTTAGTDPTQWWTLEDGPNVELSYRSILVKSFARASENNSLCRLHLSAPNAGKCAQEPIVMGGSGGTASRFVFEPVYDMQNDNRFRIRSTGASVTGCNKRWLAMHAFTCAISKPGLYNARDLKNTSSIWTVAPAMPLAPTISSVSVDEENNVVVLVTQNALTGWGPITGMKATYTVAGKKSAAVSFPAGTKVGATTWEFVLPSGTYPAGATLNIAAVANNAKAAGPSSPATALKTCPLQATISSAVISTLGPIHVFVDIPEDGGSAISSYTVVGRATGKPNISPVGSPVKVGSTLRFAFPTYLKGVNYAFTATANAVTTSCAKLPSATVVVEVATPIPGIPSIADAHVETDIMEMHVIVNLPKNLGSGVLDLVTVVATGEDGSEIVRSTDLTTEEEKRRRLQGAEAYITSEVVFEQGSFQNGLLYSIVAFVTDSAGQKSESSVSIFELVTPSEPAAPAVLSLATLNNAIVATFSSILGENDGGAAITGYTVVCTTSAGAADTITVGPLMGSSAGTGKLKLTLPTPKFDKLYTCKASAANAVGSSGLGTVSKTITVERPWLDRNGPGCELPAAGASLYMTQDSAGTPWVVYAEEPNLIVVKKWANNTQTWVQQGGAVTENGGYVPKLVFKPTSSTPFVAFAEKQPNAGHAWSYGYLSLKYLTGGIWKYAAGEDWWNTLEYAVKGDYDFEQRLEFSGQWVSGPFADYYYDYERKSNTPTDDEYYQFPGAEVVGDSISLVWAKPEVAPNKKVETLFIGFDTAFMPNDVYYGYLYEEKYTASNYYNTPLRRVFLMSYVHHVEYQLASLRDILAPFNYPRSNQYDFGEKPQVGEFGRYTLLVSYYDNNNNLYETYYTNAGWNLGQQLSDEDWGQDFPEESFGVSLTTSPDKGLVLMSCAITTLNYDMPFNNNPFTAVWTFLTGNTFDVRSGWGVLGNFDDDQYTYRYSNYIVLDTAPAINEAWFIGGEDFPNPPVAETQTKMAWTKENHLVLAINDKERNGLMFAKFRHSISSATPNYQTDLESILAYIALSNENYVLFARGLPASVAYTAEDFDFAIDGNGNPLVAVDVQATFGEAASNKFMVMRYNGFKWQRECAATVATGVTKPNLLVGSKTSTIKPVLVAYQDGTCGGAAHFDTCSDPMP